MLAWEWVPQISLDEATGSFNRSFHFFQPWLLVFFFLWMLSGKTGIFHGTGRTKSRAKAQCYFFFFFLFFIFLFHFSNFSNCLSLLDLLITNECLRFPRLFSSCQRLLLPLHILSDSVLLCIYMIQPRLNFEIHYYYFF